MLHATLQFLHAALVFSLPLCGVGLLAAITGRDWGFGLQPSWALLGLALILRWWQELLWRRNGKPQGERLLFTWADPLSRAVWLSVFLSLFILGLSGLGLVIAPGASTGSEAVWRWVKQIIQLGLMLAFFAWFGLWVQDAARWRATRRWLAAGLGFQLVYAAIQGVAFYHGSDWFTAVDQFFTSNPAILSGSEQLHLDNQMRDIPRLRGTVCEPLYLGSFLLGALPWLCVWRKGMTRLLLVLAGVVLLILTWSRGAWLAAMVQIVLVAGALLWKRVRQGGFPPRGRTWLPVAGVLVFVLFLLLVPGSPLSLLSERLAQTFSRQDWSNLTRLYSMQAAWEAFLLSPVFGIGWGQFAFHFPLLVDPMGLQSQFSWPVVNNFPLKILAETGLLGLGFTCFVLWRLFRRWWRLMSRAGRRKQALMAAALVSLAGMGVQLLTFSQYNLPHLWAFLGLAVAAVWSDHAEGAPHE